MTDFLEVGLDTIVIVLSVALTLYSYRLYHRVFRGGILAGAFSSMTIGALAFAVAETMDIVGELMQIRYISNLHVVLEAFFVIALFVGMFQLHNSWTRLGRRHTPG